MKFFSFRNNFQLFVIAELYPFIDVKELKFGFALQHRPSPLERDKRVRLKKYHHFTHAIILNGPPLPCSIFIGSATTYAPLAGS
jgi:hypothetical protein